MSDKRSVATDALQTLGTIHEEPGKRDAIHLAVEPVVAGERLLPGQHIGIKDGFATTTASKKLGIVDPFLHGIIEMGQSFWLIVYPRQITSLRHVWTHPDFDEAASNALKESILKHSVSEEWLRDYCANNDCPDYESMLERVMRGDHEDSYDEYFHIGGEDASGSIPDEFWDHMEVVAQKKIIHRPSYFSCSC